MNQITAGFLFLLLLLVGPQYSCSDAIDRADAINDRRFEDYPLEKDADFFVKFAAGTMVSMAMAEMAMKHTLNATIYTFAEKMKVEHREHYNELFRLAEAAKIALPADIPPDLYERVTSFEALPAEQKNGEYLDFVIIYHRAFAEDLKKLAIRSKYAAFVAFGNKVSGQLHLHLEEAIALRHALN